MLNIKYSHTSGRLNWKEFNETFLVDTKKYEIMSNQLIMGELKQVVDERALGVGIFDTGNCCGRWRDQNKTEIFSTYLPTVNLFKETCDGMLYQLANSKFIGYASIVIIVEDEMHLMGVLKAIRKNKCLRYKSKIIMWRFFGGNLPYSLVDKTPAIARALLMDNIIFMQWNSTVVHATFEYADVLYNILGKPFAPIQSVIQELFKRSYTNASNAELYIYSINPSLAIIINNYYFTNPHTIREGSEQDVVHLIRELKVAGIPYILVEDCNHQELLQILAYLEKKDFNPLKSFLLFLMSHGDSEDVLYTSDGQLNIKTDIVNRVQANTSLRDVEKLIIVNACRGSIDAEYADDDELEEIQPTDNSHLGKNIVVLYSVPNMIQSPRASKAGSPFIRSFCQHFRNINPADDIRVVQENINRDLKEVDYFYGFENCFESLVRDSDQCHTVVTIPENALKMLELLKSISFDFPIQNTNDGGTYYVCGALNTGIWQKCNFTGMYFSKDLDWDAFSTVGFFSD